MIDPATTELTFIAPPLPATINDDGPGGEYFN